MSSAFATGDTVEDADAGAPCFDVSRWTAVGMVHRLVNGNLQLLRYTAMQAWLDGQRNVAALRNDARNARLALFTVAPNGTRMCLDIPFGSPYDGEVPTVYPCHYGPAQRFWLDSSVDPARVRLASDASGRCLDMPSGSTLSGTNYQQFGCHLGFNQRFTYTTWNDAAGGVKLGVTHAPGQSLCLSVPFPEVYRKTCVDRFLRMLSKSIYNWVQTPAQVYAAAPRDFPPASRGRA